MNNQNTLGKFILYTLIAIFVGSIIWSIIFETILPLLRAGAITELLLNIAGISLILFGTWTFVRGGHRFVKDTLNVMKSETVDQNIKIMQTQGSPEAVNETRRQNMNLLWQSWKPGLKLLTWGFFLITLGGMCINLLKTLGQDQIF